jgi:hypothetical protein
MAEPVVTEIDIRTEKSEAGLRRLADALQKAGVGTDNVTGKLDEQSREFVRLTAGTDVASRTRLQFEAAEKRLAAALSAGRINTELYTVALDQNIAKLEAAIARTQGLGAAASGAGGGTRNLGQVVGQAGFQLQDFAVQVQGGTSALTALSQQGSQFLGIFGPTGAIAGAALAVGVVAVNLLNLKSAAELAAESSRKLDDALKGAGDSLSRQIGLGREIADTQDRELNRTADLARYYASLSDTMLDYERVRLRIQRADIEELRGKATQSVDLAIDQFRPLEEALARAERLNASRVNLGRVELEGPDRSLGEISAALRAFSAEAEKTPEVLSRLYVSLAAARDSGSQFSEELKKALDGLVAPIEQSIKLQEQIKKIDEAFAQTNLPRETLREQSGDTASARKAAEDEAAKASRAAEQQQRRAEAAADSARRAAERDADRDAEQQRRREEGLAATLQGMEREAMLAGETRAVREEELRVVEARAKVGRELTEMEEARIRTATRLRQEIEEQNRVADEARKKAERQAEQQERQDRERQAAIDDYIVSLEREAELAGLTVEKRAEELRLIEARKKAGRELTPEEESRIRNASRTKDENERMRKESEETARAIDRSFERAFDRVGDSLVDVAVKGGKAFGDLRSIAAGVATSIYADFLKLAIANPLKNFLLGGKDGKGGVFGDIVTGIGDGIFGGSSSSLTNPTSSVVGNFGGTFGGPRASGGPVDPSKWYLVGEEGPERFVPDVPGHIVPANDTAAMLEGGMRYGKGGSGGSVTIVDQRSASAPDLQTSTDANGNTKITIRDVQNEIRKSTPGIVNLTLGEVENRSARGALRVLGA